MPTKRIIRKAMVSDNIQGGDIPEEGPFISPQHHYHSKRYFQTSGFAQFSCPNGHQWCSSHSHCTIDLKTYTICYYTEQICRKCELIALPDFPEDSITKMAANVVRRYLIKTERVSHHSQDLCEMCNRLGWSCSKRKQQCWFWLPERHFKRHYSSTHCLL